MTRWLTLVFCVVFACSDTRSSSTPDAGRTQFEPERCSVAGGCDDSGQMIADPSAPLRACGGAPADTKPVAWNRSWGKIACPLGECELSSLQLGAAENSDLVAIASAAYNTPYGPLEGGVALIRYTKDGAGVAQALWDYVATPLRTAVRRHAALISDLSGQLVYASARAVWPSDEPRPLTLAAFAADDPLRTLEPHFSSERTRPVLAAMGGEGHVLVASSHHARDALVETLQLTPSDQQERPSVSLFDGQGRARWNRVWPGDSGVWRILAVHLDQQRRSTLLVRNITREQTQTLVVQLTPDGRVRWQRLVTHSSWPAEAVVDAAGNVYVLSTREEFAGAGPLQVELIDGDGRSRYLWEVPRPSGFRLQPGGARRALLSAGPEPEADRSVLRVYTLESTGACSTLDYVWPQAPEDTSFEPVALSVAADGGIYFGSSSVVGRLN